MGAILRVPAPCRGTAAREAVASSSPSRLRCVDALHDADLRKSTSDLTEPSDFGILLDDSQGATRWPSSCRALAGLPHASCTAPEPARLLLAQDHDDLLVREP
jgi:hypothetical protein